MDKGLNENLISKSKIEYEGGKYNADEGEKQELKKSSQTVNDQIRENWMCGASAQPNITYQLAFVFLLLNIMTGGVGTILSGIFDDEKDDEDSDKKNESKESRGFNVSAIHVGFLQCFLAPIFIGWIWGVMHMWTIYKGQKQKELNKKEEENNSKAIEGDKYD